VAAKSEAQAAQPGVEMDQQLAMEAAAGEVVAEADAVALEQAAEEAEAALPVVEADQLECSMVQVAVPADEPCSEPAEQVGNQAMLPTQLEVQGGGSAVGQTTSAFMEGGLAVISEVRF